MANRHPWEQREKEGDKAFRAFRVYCELPYGDDSQPRSILRAYRVLEGKGRPPGAWGRWSLKFEWRKRSEAYDRHLDTKRLKRREMAAEEHEEKWFKRSEEQREAAYNDVVLLREKLKQIINLRLYDQSKTFATIECACGKTHDQYITKITPPSPSTIAAISTLSLNLQRLMNELAGEGDAGRGSGEAGERPAIRIAFESELPEPLRKALDKACGVDEFDDAKSG